jgi:hypothetical protein
MPSKQFEEKQAVEKDLPKESSQDKWSLKFEKDNLKSEKEAIGGKEHKEKEKENYKDKDKEKELHKGEKEHKLEGKEGHLDKVPKVEGHEVYPQAQLAPCLIHRITTARRAGEYRLHIKKVLNYKHSFVRLGGRGKQLKCPVL